MKPEPRPLAFAQCACGMMMLTTAINAGNQGECVGCQYVREHPVQGCEPPPPRGERRAHAALALVAVLLVSWITFTVAVSPGRAADRPTQGDTW